MLEILWFVFLMAVIVVGGTAIFIGTIFILLVLLMLVAGAIVNWMDGYYLK